MRNFIILLISNLGMNTLIANEKNETITALNKYFMHKSVFLIFVVLLFSSNLICDENNSHEENQDKVKLALQKTIVKVKNFYSENNKWYVDFSFTNNNEKDALANLQFNIKVQNNINIESKNKKIIKRTLFNPEGNVQPLETKKYNKICIGSFAAESNQYVFVTLSSIKIIKENVIIKTNVAKSDDIIENTKIKITRSYRKDKHWNINFSIINYNRYSITNLVIKFIFWDSTGEEIVSFVKTSNDTINSYVSMSYSNTQLKRVDQYPSLKSIQVVLLYAKKIGSINSKNYFDTRKEKGNALQEIAKKEDIGDAEVKVVKSYSKDEHWCVDFSILNYNKYSITNLVIKFIFKDSSNKEIFSFVNTSSDTIDSRVSMDYFNRSLKRVDKYPSLKSIQVVLVYAEKIDPINLILATGNYFGTYKEKGEALHEIAKKEGLNIQLVGSAGSLKNLLQVSDKDVELAFTQFDCWLRIAFDPKLKSAISGVKIIIPVGTEEIHILTRKEANIKTVHDLVGKNINIGTTNSGTYITASILLPMFGITPKDFTYHHESPKIAVEMLLSGKIDALFYTIGSPVSLFSKINSHYSDKVELLELDKTTLSKVLTKSKGIYTTKVIKAGTYSWLKKDTTMLSTLSLLIANKSLPKEIVSTLFESILKNKTELKKQHHSWDIIDESVFKKIPQEYLHPGVKK